MKPSAAALARSNVMVSARDMLALGLGCGIRYYMTPAAGVKLFDQVTTVNAVYNIK